MGVDYERKLTVGWRIKTEDIPDYDERMEDEWTELDPLAEMVSKAIGKTVAFDSLIEVENMMYGDTCIVGVPMVDHAMTVDEFVSMTDSLKVLARAVYQRVARKGPVTGPYLISWTRVS